MERLIARTELLRSTRIVFALGATMSRQPTWDRAAHLQGQIFGAVPRGVEIKLMYFRG
jgi:hypothetical protein